MHFKQCRKITCMIVIWPIAKQKRSDGSDFAVIEKNNAFSKWSPPPSPSPRLSGHLSRPSLNFVMFWRSLDPDQSGVVPFVFVRWRLHHGKVQYPSFGVQYPSFGVQYSSFVVQYPFVSYIFFGIQSSCFLHFCAADSQL